MAVQAVRLALFSECAASVVFPCPILTQGDMAGRCCVS